MPYTEEQLNEMIDKRITQRFQNLGIWDTSKEQLEATRANNKLINEIRITRDEKQVVLRRSFNDILTSISGNLIYVLLTAAVVWALQYLPTGHKTP